MARKNKLRRKNCRDCQKLIHTKASRCEYCGSHQVWWIEHFGKIMILAMLAIGMLNHFQLKEQTEQTHIATEVAKEASRQSSIAQAISKEAFAESRSVSESIESLKQDAFEQAVYYNETRRDEERIPLMQIRGVATSCK